MPTVLKHPKGWRVVIYTNDHRPPHVHVIGVQQHARFGLLCDLQSIKLLSSFGFSHTQLNAVAVYLLKHVSQLCKKWGQIHAF